MFMFLMNVIIKIISMLAVGVITIGVASTMYKTIKTEFTTTEPAAKMHNRQVVRAYLGTYILLGLELLIAVDIIKTIAHPSVNEMIILAAIVLIRTFIAYFLNKEIDAVTRELDEKEKAEIK